MSDEDKNFTYRVFWSDEDEMFVGVVAEFPSLSWLADSEDEALSGIHEIVAGTIADMKEDGEWPRPNA